MGDLLPPQDPQARVSTYLQEHKVVDIMECLLAELLFHKPPDPRAFIIEWLERIKSAGARPLLDARDLGSMFNLFDVTRTGAVTAAQANAALATALGAARAAAAVEASTAAAAAAKGGVGNGGAPHPLAAKGAEARQMRKDEFVQVVGDVLIRATPDCQLTSLEGADDEEGGGGGGGV